MQLVWFRNDLRLQDNPALYFAAEKGPVLPVYIESPGRPDGAYGAWWRQESLKQLKVSLEKKGVSLLTFSGNVEEILTQLVKTYNITHIHWNRLYEPDAIERDKYLKSLFQEKGIGCTSYAASLLFEPWETLNKQGTFFKVFTPFWKECQQKLEPITPPIPEPEKIMGVPGVVEKNKQPDKKGPPDTSLWTPGEHGAWTRLKDFVEEGLPHYSDQRDIPSVQVTSRLSAPLRFGEISPRQILFYLKEKAPHTPSAAKFLSEVGWREFSYNLLFHFPELPHKNFNPKFNGFPWRAPSEYAQDFEAWKAGKTGIPLVDAGMRELRETGTMHNRVRMVTASFLTKNLLIPWQEGEAYFWELLLDADPANNPASWQWVAGSGADAAPYFRVFNPELQADKFDPEKRYIRKWLPAGENIPPIVDLKASRERALIAYKSLQEAAHDER